MTDESRKTGLGLVIAASTIGTVFEWYDFYIFGSLASVIAKAFFAQVSERQGLFFALLTFAAGFAVRPIGALAFGYFGDRYGRKRAFLVTVTLMGAATFAIGILPSYAAWGVIAPYSLVFLRVLQGFAVGGEYGGAAVYVAEYAPAKRRGFATGWIQVSAAIGLFLALSVILAVRTIVGEALFAEWAWRVPFLISLVLFAVSLWIRLRLEETPLYRQLRDAGGVSRAPLSEAFLQWSHLRIVLIVLFGLLMAHGVIWYTAQFYTLFFLQNIAKVDALVVNELLLAATSIGIVLHIFFAWLSDKVGRKPVMLFGLGLAVLSFFPAFHALTQAANPMLVSAAQRIPVAVIAVPQDCSLQFDLVGKSKFLTSCDIAKNALATAGIPYRNIASASGLARVRIGDKELVSVDGGTGASFATARKDFETQLKAGLVAAGYPAKADNAKIDTVGVIIALLVLITAAAALYGPQAAALTELFPTRIRYSALSFPYHIGVGWFGGFLPATAFAIVAATGNIYAGLWYPVAIAAMGFVVTLLFLPETVKFRLTDEAGQNPAPGLSIALEAPR